VPTLIALVFHEERGDASPLFLQFNCNMLFSKKHLARSRFHDMALPFDPNLIGARRLLPHFSLKRKNLKKLVGIHLQVLGPLGLLSLPRRMDFNVRLQTPSGHQLIPKTHLIRSLPA